MHAQQPPRTDIFNAIYEKSGWVNGSGAGSSPAYTAQYREFLQDYLRQHNVRRVLDIGCGDWQFSCLLDWRGVDYTGIDVASGVIAQNQQKWAKPGIRFIHADAETATLPEADLVIVKDCLQHLSNAAVSRILDRLRSYPRVLIVQDSAGHRVNLDCADGGYRPLDVRKSPFDIPSVPVFAFGKNSKVAHEWLPSVNLPQLTVSLLNWKRPENVGRIAAAYEKYSAVKEVIVWNNNRDTALEPAGKLQVINCSRDFGLDTRFHAALLASTEAVLIQDDDILLPEETLNQLLRSWQAQPDIVHGLFGRRPKPDGTYSTEFNKKDAAVDVVLTRALVTSRSKIPMFFAARQTEAVKRVEDLCEAVGTQRHNGEDILFSYTVKHLNAGKPNRTYDLKAQELPQGARVAISAHRQHWPVRTEMMRICRALYGEPMHRLWEILEDVSTDVPLSRYGPNEDGGYLVPALEYDRVVTVGVGNDIRFEVDLAKDFPGCAFDLYDPTVSRLPCPLPHSVFLRQGLGIDFTVDQIAPKVLREHMLLKIDCEGAEWTGGLHNADLSWASAIVLEIHHLHQVDRYEDYLRVLDNLLTDHVLVNCHPNNHGKTFVLDGVNRPKVIELTFMRDDLYVAQQEAHPQRAANHPCHPDRPELELASPASRV